MNGRIQLALAENFCEKNMSLELNTRFASLIVRKGATLLACHSGGMSIETYSPKLLERWKKLMMEDLVELAKPLHLAYAVDGVKVTFSEFKEYYTMFVEDAKITE